MPSDLKPRKPSPSAQSVGQEKERLAERFLLGKRLELIARNHRCRFGEIDLVMRDGGVLVFVEVRYRRSAQHGSAAETVDVRKQRRLIKTAGHYLQYNPTSRPCRFDVVAITGDDQVQWIRNAFVLDAV
ncbi:YraN family protein [Thiocystis violacea]|uniref:YraN family protein n=1 Tax=Thiocystis violacea TaxID=13725 RepID=UPI0019074E1F|nr:YraN family protein [Thiocystis violacea]MBK1721733.1 YraN family protein [Thiocystis violacea]